jgi:2-polyprenyl-6-methoxyphenol hydroxylase-like FAD-dependent oxidoreductase
LAINEGGLERVEWEWEWRVGVVVVVVVWSGNWYFVFTAKWLRSCDSVFSIVRDACGVFQW